MKKFFVLLSSCLSVVLSLCLFSACSANMNAGQPSEAEKDRAYLAQVNDLLSNMDGDLKSFTDAASRNDLVAVQSNAKKINDTISSISNLDVPDDMKSVHDQYVSGCNALKQALNDYVSLYCDVINRGGDVNAPEYAQKLAAIQSQYNNGLKVLKDADQALADLNKNKNEGDNAAASAEDQLKSIEEKMSSPS